MNKIKGSIARLTVGGALVFASLYVLLLPEHNIFVAVTVLFLGLVLLCNEKDSDELNEALKDFEDWEEL